MASKWHKLSSLLLWLSLLACCLASTPSFAAACDVDSDGDIDSRDIFLIEIPNTGRQTTEPNDPKDPNKNGIINNKDVRICKSRCTLAGCEIITNSSPVAKKDRASTIRGKSITINLTANDLDGDGRIVANTVRIVTKPQNGRVRNLGNGTVSYTPKRRVNGRRDSFEYEVKDNRGAVSNVAKVIVRITNGNQPPIANAGLDTNARVEAGRHLGRLPVVRPRTCLVDVLLEFSVVAGSQQTNQHGNCQPPNRRPQLYARRRRRV